MKEPLVMLKWISAEPSRQHEWFPTQQGSQKKNMSLAHKQKKAHFLNVAFFVTLAASALSQPCCRTSLVHLQIHKESPCLGRKLISLHRRLYVECHCRRAACMGWPGCPRQSIVSEAPDLFLLDPSLSWACNALAFYFMYGNNTRKVAASSKKSRTYPGFG